MRPKTISASSALTYESCPARYLAEVINKARNPDGSAAGLGTACHGAMEEFIKAGCHLSAATMLLSTLLRFYDVSYWNSFSDKSRYDEGRELLEKWFKRQDFSDRTVLSTEAKSNFTLKIPGYEIPVTYIWDRCDELKDGTIEVVDYKTVGMPIGPDELKKRIQPRVYGLSAAIQYPNRPAYWVVYDLLRYEPVGVKFTREDNVETYRYLQALYTRILNDDGTKETLNPDCRWCVRNNVCETLLHHANAGGILRITDPMEAADARAKLDYARGAIAAQMKDLDEFLLAYAESEGLLEFRTAETEVRISASTRREVDAERAAKVLGPDIMMRYGKLQLKDIDEILKKGGLDPTVRSELKQLIRKRATAATVRTKPLAVMGDD